MHYTSPKDVRMIAVRNNIRKLACLCIINYDLHNTLMLNHFDAIHKLLSQCNIFYDSQYSRVQDTGQFLVTVMKFIGLLLIRPFNTTNGNSLCFPYALVGLEHPLSMGFLTLQERSP